MVKKEPLYISITNELRTAIESGNYSNGEQLPTELELMKKYDVSRVTARKSLDSLVMEGLIERFPGKGTFVSGKVNIATQKRTFGVILPAISPCFGTQLLYKISARLQKENINLLYMGTEDDQYTEAKVITDITKTQIDGLIIWPASGEFIGKELLRLILEEFPIVLIDRYIQDAKVSFVSTDNYKTIEKALKYLIELGHKKIAIASKLSDHNSSIRDRLLAAQLYLSENKDGVNYFGGVLEIPKFDREDPKDIAEKKAELLATLKKFLVNNKEITSFMVTEYYPATLLYECLTELGYSVPDDYSIICFDSPDFSLEHAIRFTHLRQREDILAEKSVDLLLSVIENPHQIQNDLIDADLIIGETTKKI